MVDYKLGGDFASSLNWRVVNKGYVNGLTIPNRKVIPFRVAKCTTEFHIMTSNTGSTFEDFDYTMEPAAPSLRTAYSLKEIVEQLLQKQR